MSEIDEIDRRIVRELNRNGRISNIRLAEVAGLSPSACLRRVQELERRGVIRGYRAVTDPVQMGHGFVAYVMVGLSSHTKAAQEGFERAMSCASSVVECHNIAGAFEYILRVETRDLASYKNFHTDVLGTTADVATISSYLVMGTPKDMRG